MYIYIYDSCFLLLTTLVALNIYLHGALHETFTDLHGLVLLKNTLGRLSGSSQKALRKSSRSSEEALSGLSVRKLSEDSQSGSSQKTLRRLSADSCQEILRNLQEALQEPLRKLSRNLSRKLSSKLSPGSSPGSSHEALRSLSGNSQETPRRLPGGISEAIMAIQA